VIFKRWESEEKRGVYGQQPQAAQSCQKMKRVVSSGLKVLGSYQIRWKYSEIDYFTERSQTYLFSNEWLFFYRPSEDHFNILKDHSN
jgi:hypothetical protein